MQRPAALCKSKTVKIVLPAWFSWGRSETALQQPVIAVLWRGAVPMISAPLSLSG